MTKKLSIWWEDGWEGKQSWQDEGCCHRTCSLKLETFPMKTDLAQWLVMLDYERVPSSMKENMQMLMSLLTLENTAFCDSRTLFSRINNICLKDQYWIYV